MELAVMWFFFQGSRLSRTDGALAPPWIRGYDGFWTPTRPTLTSNGPFNANFTVGSWNKYIQKIFSRSFLLNCNVHLSSPRKMLLFTSWRSMSYTMHFGRKLDRSSYLKITYFLRKTYHVFIRSTILSKLKLSKQNLRLDKIQGNSEL